MTVSRSGPPLGPLAGPLPPVKRNTSAAQADGPNKDQSAQEAAAQQKARAIQNEVDMARKQTIAIRTDLEAQKSQLETEYEKQMIAETSNQTAAIESQRLKGYQALRDLQRNQAAEQSRVKREGEHDLAGLEEHYRTAIYRTDTQGDGKLREMQAMHQKEVNFLAQEHANETTALQTRQTEQISTLNQTQGTKYQALADEAKTLYEAKRENYLTNTEKAEAMFQQDYARVLARSQAEIGALGALANRQMEDLRENSADKLTKYAARQEDPFYKQVDLQAQLEDRGDAFVLTAKIPEHEQGNISITVNNDQLTISGYRRNEEHLDQGAGFTRTTNAYQSFTQTFPLNWPVDRRSLDRKFEGDRLTITLPKKTGYVPPQSKGPIDPERAKGTVPRFPENLPGGKPKGMPSIENSGADAAPGKGSNGRAPRTLS